MSTWHSVRNFFPISIENVYFVMLVYKKIIGLAYVFIYSPTSFTKFV